MRRIFQLVLGLWGFGFIGVVLSYLKTPERRVLLQENLVRVGPLEDLKVGTARFMAHERQPFWVIRPGPQKLVALSAICTHFRCIVQWDSERERLVCPCHAGSFDINGNVRSGPPPRPLQRLRVEVRGGDIYVTLA